MNELISVLDTQWMDAYLDALLEERILNADDVHFAMFEGVASEARFHLFDHRTEKAIRAFVTAWSRLHEVTRYGDAVTGRTYANFKPEYFALESSVAEVRKELHDARNDLFVRFREMLARIRMKYPEFDLKESDLRARAALKSLSAPNPRPSKTS